MGQFFCSHTFRGRLTHTHTARSSSTVAPRQGSGSTFPSAETGDRLDKLSSSHATKASSPTWNKQQGTRQKSWSMFSSPALNIWGQLTGNPVFEAISMAPLPTGSALLCCPSRCRAWSTSLMTLVSAILSATGGKGWGERNEEGISPSHIYCCRTDKKWGHLSYTHVLGPDQLDPINRVNSTILFGWVAKATQDSGPALLSSVPDEGRVSFP